MIDREILLKTTDGAMSTFVTQPEEGGPSPVVFFYMDAPGKREELHDMARRLGSAGYTVLLPNLYYREVEHFELVRDDEVSVKEMFRLMSTLSNASVVADTQALFDFIDGDDQAVETRVGCMGYCMSGPFSLAVAAAFPTRVRAAASLYGVRLATEAADSPHLSVKNIAGEVYVAAAELDQHIQAAEVNRLEAAFAEAKTNARVEWYPGADHGFAFPGRGAAYDKPSAERHWERLHALFQRNL